MPCGINLDNFYDKLLAAEQEGTAAGYRMSVDLLFPDGDLNETTTQEDSVEA